MRKLRYVEFYITNVCNLNCNNCNRFNNFAFSGHELWSTHKEVYRSWSQTLDFDRISILGGEPLTNPEFIDWVRGVAKLWPNSELSVVTNGTQLDRWPDLYRILVENKERMYLEVTLHGNTLKEYILNKVDNFLIGPIQKIFSTVDFPTNEWQTTWDCIKDPSWPDCPTVEDLYNLSEAIQRECFEMHDIGHYRLVDKNGVTFKVSNQAKFVQSAIRLEGNKIVLHHSDPQKAVNACISKYCHHFSQGKLYKCGVTGVLPSFLEQFPVDLTNRDRSIIYSYKPAEVYWSQQDLDMFLKNLKTGAAIDYCQFCTESKDTFAFESSQQKPKVIKIKNLK